MFVAITPKYDGSHGFDVVGGFESREAAKAWLNGRDGMVHPVVSPEAHMAHRDDAAANPPNDDE